MAIKQLRGTAIGTNFAPPYTIIFMTDFEEKILEDIEHMVEHMVEYAHILIRHLAALTSLRKIYPIVRL